MGVCADVNLKPDFFLDIRFGQVIDSETLWATYEFWQLSSGPLEEQKLFTTESSL